MGSHLLGSSNATIEISISDLEVHRLTSEMIDAHQGMTTGTSTRVAITTTDLIEMIAGTSQDEVLLTQVVSLDRIPSTLKISTIQEVTAIAEGVVRCRTAAMTMGGPAVMIAIRTTETLPVDNNLPSYSWKHIRFRSQMSI